MTEEITVAVDVTEEVITVNITANEAIPILRYGSGAPSNGLGIVGDSYINTANDFLYEKTGVSAWTLRVELASGEGGSSAWEDITGTPTTLAGYGIADAQPLDSDLTAIAALATSAEGRALLALSPSAAQLYYWNSVAWTALTTTASSRAFIVGSASSATLRGILTDETGTGLAYFQGGDLGTPSAGVATNLTGTAASLTAGNVTTNANLTGDVTSSGNATTLATVNSNVGSFGSGSLVPVITVNAKGLITAISTTAVSGGGGGSGTKTIAVFTPRDNQPPASNFATLDTRNSVAVLDFDDATNESAVFVGVIPEGAVLTSGLYVFIHWTATSGTSGQVKWGAQFERGNTDLDSDSFDTATDNFSSTSGTNGVIMVTGMTCTDIDGLTAGDTFRIRIYRDAADGTNDTLSGDAELVTVEVRTAN